MTNRLTSGKPWWRCTRLRRIVFKAILKCRKRRCGPVHLVLVDDRQGVIRKRLILREHSFDQHVVNPVPFSRIEAAVEPAELENGPHRALASNKGTVKLVPQASPSVAITLRCHPSMMAQSEFRLAAWRSRGVSNPFREIWGSLRWHLRLKRNSHSGR